MRGNQFKILIGLFLVAVLGLLVSLYYYNKPHVDVKHSEAAYILTVQNLIDEYQTDENESDKKYSENVIQVQGTVFEISTLKGNSVITLKDEGFESSIICHMLPEDNKRALQLKMGDEINIKGICTGYLMDVIMVRCTLVD
ncbi:MAG: OB-fold putative lipoprotein [Maribacter sp.]|nr:OB-fold putative lipoprotein [Maribacter sp.]